MTRPAMCDFDDDGRLYMYQQQQKLKLQGTSSWAAPALVRYKRCYGIQIMPAGPLSSSKTGQDAVLGKLSTAFGLCGRHSAHGISNSNHEVDNQGRE